MDQFDNNEIPPYLSYPTYPADEAAVPEIQVENTPGSVDYRGDVSVATDEIDPSAYVSSYDENNVYNSNFNPSNEMPLGLRGPDDFAAPSPVPQGFPSENIPFLPPVNSYNADPSEAANVPQNSIPKEDEVYEVQTEIMDGVIRKNFRRRNVFISPEAQPLFNEILEYRNANPITNVYPEALKLFGTRRYGDAVVKAIYGAQFYDYILKYKSKDEKDDRMFERSRYERLLVETGLVLEKEDAPDGIHVYVKIITPFSKLCEEAENMRLKFMVREEIAKEVETHASQTALDKIANFMFHEETDGLSSVFKTDKLSAFEGGNANEIGWPKVLETFFSTAKRVLMTYNIVTHLKLSGYRHKKTVGIRKLLIDGVYTEFFPLHDGPCKSTGVVSNLRAILMRTWANLNQMARKQPLDDIREYYGEKIAFYFAFLGYYTFMLFFAAALGLIVFFYGVGAYASQGDSDANVFDGIARIFDNEVTIIYTFLMSVWASVFLELFKRYSVRLAYRWDVIGYEKEEIERPEFNPTAVRISPITGKWERYEPKMRYKMKKFVGIIAVILCLVIVLAALGGNILLSVYSSGQIVPSIVSLVTIIILGQIYHGISIKLTNWENHRTETEYENALITKQFLFNFVNYYSSLLYIGIIRTLLVEDINFPDPCYKPCDSCRQSCMVDLTQQLVIIFIGKQMLNQAIEIGIPWAFKKYTEYTSQKAEKQAAIEKDLSFDEIQVGDKVPRHQKDDNLNKYVSMIDDYNEMAVQFGFVMLFVSSFPLGALFAYINNIFEIRFDAQKMLTDYQRPVPYAAANIGTWYRVLSIVSLIAVLTNAALIAFTSNYFYDTFLARLNPNEVRLAQVLFIVVYEHAVFAVKLLISRLIPDTPTKISEALQREEYITKVRIGGEPSARDDPEALEILNAKSDNSRNV